MAPVKLIYHDLPWIYLLNIIKYLKSHDVPVHKLYQSVSLLEGQRNHVPAILWDESRRFTWSSSGYWSSWCFLQCRLNTWLTLTWWKKLQLQIATGMNGRNMKKLWSSMMVICFPGETSIVLQATPGRCRLGRWGWHRLQPCASVLGKDGTGSAWDHQELLGLSMLWKWSEVTSG